MRWFPALHFGFCNAWTFLVPVVLHPLLLAGVDRALGRRGILSKLGEAPGGRSGRAAELLDSGLLLLLCGYAAFLPLRLWTAGLWAGAALALAGVALLLAAAVAVSNTPPGSVFRTGIYRYSRHPLYLALGLMLIAAGLAAGSGTFLLLAAAYAVLLARSARVEEARCLERFGEAYREYARQAPRWLGCPAARHRS